MSALHMEKITEHSKDFHRTENLYVRAFPANERTPICGLMRHDGHDFVGFYDKDENFCGFAKPAHLRRHHAHSVFRHR